MKERYFYPAIFENAHDGINVYFPDLPGALTCAEKNNYEEAFKNAKEALELYMYTLEDEGMEIPVPSNIKPQKENESVVLIEAYMPIVRMDMETRSVNRTVTLPEWLDKRAKEKGINFSQTLQAALYQQMNLPFTPQKRKSGN